MRNGFIAIPMSFLVAFFLMLLPMPDWTIWLRPAWVLMMIIYWIIIAPHSVNVGVAWFLGVVVDLLTGSLLGEHALAYTLVAFLVVRMRLRLRMFSLLQQSLIVLMLLLFYQAILYCLQGFVGETPTNRLYWLSSVTSMLLWPWLMGIMHRFQRQHQHVS